MSKSIAIFSVFALSVVSVASTVSQQVQLVEEGEDAPVVAHMAAPQSYRLGALGAGSCTVQLGVEVSDSEILLKKDGNCDAVYPALANATVWRQLDDGTVFLTDAGGRPVVEFSQADGEGLESVIPAAPFLALVPTTTL